MVSFHSILKGVYIFSIFIFVSSTEEIQREPEGPEDLFLAQSQLISNIKSLFKNPNPLSVDNVPARGTKTTQTPEELVRLKRHAGLSASAYCRSVSLFKRWNCPSCQSSVPDGRIVFTFRSTIYDINGFILNSEQHKTIYLVFRGTNSIGNVVSDANVLVKNYRGIKGAFVHEGFYDAFNTVTKEFLPALLSHIRSYPSFQIVVTGHSLGGATATLAAAYLFEFDRALFGPDRMELYTYGAPRVGNEVFAKYLVSTGLYNSRSVHKADIAPTFPPTSLGFVHAGIESHIIEDPDTVEVCTSNLESSLCKSPLSPFSVTDHLNYYGYTSAVCLDII